jgi:hypothetical protein
MLAMLRRLVREVISASHREARTHLRDRGAAEAARTREGLLGDLRPLDAEHVADDAARVHQEDAVVTELGDELADGATVRWPIRPTFCSAIRSSLVPSSARIAARSSSRRSANALKTGVFGAFVPDDFELSDGAGVTSILVYDLAGDLR